MSNTTIVVSFATPGSGGNVGSAHLSAEIDSRPEGLNGGKTSFAPGDDVYILVYKSTNVSITTTDCSAGSISDQGSVSVTTKDDVPFANSNTSSVNKPASSGLLSQKWLGRNLGTITMGADQTTLSIATAGIGVAKVSYQSTALVYKLSSPATLDGEVDFTILVMIIGDVTA